MGTSSYATSQSALSALHADDAQYQKDCMAIFRSNTKALEHQGGPVDESFELVVSGIRAAQSHLWN